MRRRDMLTLAAAPALLPASRLLGATVPERRLLYVTEPGIRNYVSYGGVGVLVYDIGKGYEFVKRIPTWSVAPDKEPENVKGVVASARTGRLFVSTIKRLGCIDLLTDRMVWDKELEGGCDRMALSPGRQPLSTSRPSKGPTGTWWRRRRAPPSPRS